MERKVSNDKAVFDGEYPNPPKVPEDVQERFASMAIYNSDMAKWWDDLKRMMERDREELRRRLP